MKISEKVAYIKGLAEGLSLDEKTPEGKVLASIIDVLDDMAKAISGLKEDTEYLDAYVEEIDEDLGTLEEDYYECDCCCDDEDIYEVKCPNCDEEICIDGSVLDKGEIQCPNCGETLTFEFDDECDCCCEDDCDCGCDK